MGPLLYIQTVYQISMVFVRTLTTAFPMAQDTTPMAIVSLKTGDVIYTSFQEIEETSLISN